MVQRVVLSAHRDSVPHPQPACSVWFPQHRVVPLIQSPDWSPVEFAALKAEAKAEDCVAVH